MRSRTGRIFPTAAATAVTGTAFLITSLARTDRGAARHANGSGDCLASPGGSTGRGRRTSSRC